MTALTAGRDLATVAPRALAPIARPFPAAQATAARPPTRGATLFGLAVIAVFVGGFGAWSALAPLSEAAIGPGVIKAEGNRRTVQHLEGGIVRAILVRDGDRVAAGQVLVRLDDVQTGAQREALEAQRFALLAQDARLAAELAGAAEIAWPADLLARRDEPRIADLIAGQSALFVSRTSAFVNSQAVLRARAEQHRAALASAQGQIASQERQAALIRDEMKGVEELLRLGLERRPRLLALQRAEASLVGNREDLLGQIARAEAGLAETTAQMRADADARLAEAGREQRDVRARLIEVEEKLNQARDVAARRDILAPEDGVVLNLRHFTLGGVIKPGEPVLDLVPAQDRLIAEVLVQPGDIDTVHPGLEAELRLTAFKQRLAPMLRGTVEFVAADAVYDERLRADVYRAHVSIPDSELAQLGGSALTPGMPVEAMILVGERTFWQYITQPLLDSFARAFREQ
jgi:HlyD family secretion protein